LESIGRALSQAGRQIRDESVDPALLKKMQMNPEEFRVFVEAYQEKFDEVRHAPAGEAERVDDGDREFGSREVQRGEGVSDTVGRVTGAEEGPSETDPKAVQQRSQTVSPEYKQDLEAYLRTVSEESK
jgi:hypothetical protein